MYFTALKKTAASAVLFLMACACLASDTQPRILKEPVLGLRYDISKTPFEPLPASESANCETNDNFTSVWFVYAKFKTSSGRTYYISGGYDIWKNPEPDQPRYEPDEYGLIFFTEGDKCVHIDEARQTFIDRVFNDEMTQQTLQGLALDAVARLEKAFGGPRELRTELRKQHVDIKNLPIELRRAFKAYTIPVSSNR